MWTMFCMEKSVQSYKATMKSTPTERVTLDTMGPLHVSLTEQGNRYILVIGDNFIKWTKAYANPDQEAETVAKKLVNEFICCFVVSIQLHTKPGMIFESPLLIQMTKLLWIIQKTRTTVLHPQSEDIIERFKKVIDRDNARCLIRSRIRDIKPLRVVFIDFSHVH